MLCDLPGFRKRFGGGESRRLEMRVVQQGSAGMGKGVFGPEKPVALDGRMSMDIGNSGRDMPGMNIPGMNIPYYREKMVRSGSKGMKEDRHNGVRKETEGEDSWEEKLKKWDQEMERIREENRREQKRLQEERLRKKRVRKKLQEKLAWKQYLARQDEIHQMNEKISIERAVGEDVYIEKPPLCKSLSAAEIMAICSEC